MGSYGQILGKFCQKFSNKFCELGRFWSHSSKSNGNSPVLTCGACSCRHKQTVEPKHDTLSPDSVQIWAILWRPGTRHCAEIQENPWFLGKPPIGIVPRHHIKLDKVMGGWVIQKFEHVLCIILLITAPERTEKSIFIRFPSYPVPLLKVLYIKHVQIFG